MASGSPPQDEAAAPAGARRSIEGAPPAKRFVRPASSDLTAPSFAFAQALGFRGDTGRRVPDHGLPKVADTETNDETAQLDVQNPTKVSAETVEAADQYKIAAQAEIQNSVETDIKTSKTAARDITVAVDQGITPAPDASSPFLPFNVQADDLPQSHGEKDHHAQDFELFGQDEFAAGLFSSDIAVGPPSGSQSMTESPSTRTEPINQKHELPVASGYIHADLPTRLAPSPEDMPFGPTEDHAQTEGDLFVLPLKASEAPSTGAERVDEELQDAAVVSGSGLPARPALPIPGSLQDIVANSFAHSQEETWEFLSKVDGQLKGSEWQLQELRAENRRLMSKSAESQADAEHGQHGDRIWLREADIDIESLRRRADALQDKYLHLRRKTTAQVHKLQEVAGRFRPESEQRLRTCSRLNSQADKIKHELLKLVKIINATSAYVVYSYYSLEVAAADTGPAPQTTRQLQVKFDEIRSRVTTSSSRSSRPPTAFAPAENQHPSNVARAKTPPASPKTVVSLAIAAKPKGIKVAARQAKMPAETNRPRSASEPPSLPQVSGLSEEQWTLAQQCLNFRAASGLSDELCFRLHDSHKALEIEHEIIKVENSQLREQIRRGDIPVGQIEATARPEMSQAEVQCAALLRGVARLKELKAKDKIAKGARMARNAAHGYEHAASHAAATGIQAPEESTEVPDSPVHNIAELFPAARVGSLPSARPLSVCLKETAKNDKASEAGNKASDKIATKKATKRKAAQEEKPAAKRQSREKGRKSQEEAHSQRAASLRKSTRAQGRAGARDKDGSDKFAKQFGEFC